MGKKFNKQDAYGQLLLDADLGAAADEMDLNLRTKAPTLKKWPSDGGWNWSLWEKS